MSTRRSKIDEDVLHLSDYEIERFVGEGMLGKVYRALDTRNEHVVALKVLKPEAALHAQQLQNEFRLLSTFRHHHLADVFDYGLTNTGRPYYAMQWIPGEPVSRHHLEAPSGDIDPVKVAEFIRQITSALIYIRSRNLVHGDIKPENILVSFDRSGTMQVVLMDFGISRSFDSSIDGVSGTFAYMAPEIIRGDAPRSASDLYSLGCVLYELLSGKPPFIGETPLEVLKHHLYTRPEELPPLEGTDIPVLPWIMTLLEKDIRLRYRIPEQLHALACEYLDKEPDTEIRESESFTTQLIDVPRDTELAKFKEIAESSATHFQCIFVQGPDGLGKSTLLKDFKVQLQLEGKKVHTLSYSGLHKPFEHIVSFLANAVYPSKDAAFEEAVAIAASMFPESFPDISPAPNAGLSADGTLLRLFDALSYLITSTDTTALIIDNLHEADDLTLEFLAFYISYADSRDTKGKMLAASFDAEALNRELFPEDLQNAWVTIPLQPLTQDIISKNIETMFGSDLSPSFHAFVWNQSHGIPALAEEIIQYCIDEGVLERTRHGWTIHERDNLVASLPASVLEKTKRKLERIGENATQLLKALVLAQAPVDPPVLEHVLRRSIDRIHELGIELLKYHLMNVSAGQYTCNADVLSSLLEYTSEEKQTIHTRYIEYFQKYPETAPPEGILAEHFLGAGQYDEAVTHFMNAKNASEKIFDYATTKKYLLKVISVPGALQNDEERFDTFASVVHLCNILGDRDCEAEYIEELLILAGRWKESAGAYRLARASELQTEYYLALAEFDKAKRSTERALKNFEEADNQLGIAQSKRSLGFILYRTQPSEAVLDYYIPAQKIFSSIQALEDEANILIDIGLVYYNILNRPEDALRCYDEAKALFREAGISRGVARAYGNAGVQHFALGDYEAALEMHRKANEIFTNIGDLRARAISHIHIGRSLYAIGQYVHAIQELNKALTIGKTLADNYVQENSHESIGAVYFHLGQYDQARTSFTVARELAEKSGYSLGAITNTLDIAEILIEQGEMKTALEDIAKSERLLDTIKEMNVLCGCMYRYGQAYSAKGDTQDFNTALQYFIRQHELAEQFGYDDHTTLALSYMALCNAHLGNTEEALDQSARALKLLDKLGYLVGGKQDILLNHAKILRANKQIEDAEDYIHTSFDEVMRIAAFIDDPSYYRSFTEQVAVNADIIREYSLLNRTSSPESLSVSKDQNLRTLYEVSRKINSVLDLPRLLENIMDSALDAMNGERGLIFLLENNELVLRVSRNVEKETIKDATEISLSILKDVVSGGKPIIIADTSKDDTVKSRQSIVNFNIHSIICVPMKSKDQIIGTVYVDSRADALSAMSFSEIDVDFLEAFSNLASMAIENSRLHTQLREENLYLKQEVSRQFGFENIIGSSKPMEHLFREMQGAIASSDSVLIYGESGTGKELIARAIHYNGKRKDRRFVAVDCGAMQDTLLESELFGYKRGAFTGAVADKRGLFEEAHRGTLFLDEIGNTSLAFQAKLLRVLQSGEFRRVGDTDTRRVDVRIIAATNTDIQQQIAAGAFRQDLYYRLNVIPLRVPELRVRLEDIPALVQHFVQIYNEKYQAKHNGASKELIDVLQTYPWPGNVRELENLVNRMLAQSNTDMLTTRNLPEDFDIAAGKEQIGKRGRMTMKIPVHLKTLREIEQEHIRFVLQHTGNNKTEAAKILGLKRTTLVEKMKKLELM